MSVIALKRALRPGGVSTGLIKGESSTEAGPGLVPGYSASGQDIWLPRATHFGPGLVLSAVGARCGKVFQADGAWSVVANTVVLTPQPGHDPRFLWYLTNDENFWEKGGTAQPYVRVPATLAQKVWLPALDQQRAIADYLDTETARIDTLIRTKVNFRTLLDEKLLSLIQEHVGTIPTRRRLRHLAKLGTGHTPGRRNSDYWENCVIPWVTAEDLSSRGNPFEPLMDTRQKISALGVANSAAVVHPSGTVMLCRTASVGLICRVGIPMATTQAFVTWSPGHELDSGFLMYALHSLRQEWMRLAFGSTHDTIYMPDLESVKIPYISLTEQRAIARKLDASTSQLLEARNLLNQQCELLKERRRALIAAGVTGELKVPA